MKTTTTVQLQLALDFLELSRALQVAREAVDAGIDILEAGTPLIKSEGLNAVRALRKEFPKQKIVADMKTMDAGRMEMESAAKSGADIVVVLGAASDSTIRECVEAARNYGFELEVDLVGLADPVRRAQEVAALGVELIGVHCPIDEQMRGKDPFETLRAVRKVVDVKLACAGGINSESAAKAVEAGADIVIVGGAISKSTNAKSATAAIRRAMDSQKSIPSQLFKRAQLGNLHEILSQVSTPNLSDAMHRSGELDGLLPLQQGKKVFGPAVTVRTYPGDWAKPVEAIDLAQPGDIIVIDAAGKPPAVWGELASESCLQRKIAAVVIDGAIRDVDAIRAMGFPAWARHQTPTAWEPKGFGEIGAPIVAGGQKIQPGDWIVADDSGVLRIPKEKLVEVVNRAMDVFERENRLREEIRRGSTLSQVGEVLRWEKK